MRLTPVAAFGSSLLLSLPIILARPAPPARADLGHVVVSEVAWAGSSDSTYDEWVELANPTGSTVDLTGWTLVDGTMTYPLSGSIPAQGFFLVERREEATSVVADLLVSGLSLSNTGEHLELRSATGTTVDHVNPAGSMWTAGGSTTKATMERVSPALDAGDAASWASSTASGPATASLGSPVLGTPRAANSVAAPAGPQVTLDGPSTPVAPGSDVTLTLAAHDIVGLMSFGIDLTYPSATVTNASATEGSFLAGSPPVGTAFQSGLVDGDAGTLRLGGSRLTTPPSSVDGDGTLATVTLHIASSASGSITVGVAPGAFAAGVTGDLPGVTFSGATLTVGAAVEPVTNLTVVPGSARYSLALAWDAPAGGADEYQVARQEPDGSFTELGTVTATSFTDDDGVTGGGAIVPTRSYTYEVTALRGEDASAPVQSSGTDPRGLLGDSTRDDTTDGRDLTTLARSWGLASNDSGFVRLADTSVDGAVDGDDLVDLAQNWARTYTAP